MCWVVICLRGLEKCMAAHYPRWRNKARRGEAEGTLEFGGYLSRTFRTIQHCRSVPTTPAWSGCASWPIRGRPLKQYLTALAIDRDFFDRVEGLDGSTQLSGMVAYALTGLIDR